MMKLSGILFQIKVEIYVESLISKDELGHT